MIDQVPIEVVSQVITPVHIASLHPALDDHAER